MNNYFSSAEFLEDIRYTTYDCTGLERIHAVLDMHMMGEPSHILRLFLMQEQVYRIAGNIGGEFNLADWRICESTTKLNSAMHHAVLLVPRHMVSDRQIKFRQTAKITNPPNITPANLSGYTVYTCSCIRNSLTQLYVIESKYIYIFLYNCMFCFTSYLDKDKNSYRVAFCHLFIY